MTDVFGFIGFMFVVAFVILALAVGAAFVFFVVSAVAIGLGKFFKRISEDA